MTTRELVESHVPASPREVLAKDCKLESVNNNLNRQNFGSQQPDGYTVNGSMTLQITLK